MFEQPSIVDISRFNNLQKFYKLVEPEAKIISARWFKSVATENSRIGHGRFNLRGTEETISYVEFNIYIDRDSFVLPKNDYRALIPIMVRHEAAELFKSVNIFKENGVTPQSQLTNLVLRWVKDDAHAFALVEEHRLAKSLKLTALHKNFFNEYASLYSDLNLSQMLRENFDIAELVSREVGV